MIWNQCRDDAQVEWFPHECCQKHANYDRRTPGLFKLEASGDEMICLSSKTYLLKSGREYKLSCKGVSKATIQDVGSIFKRALFQKENVYVTNKGFRARENGVCTYRQTKLGFGYFYCKRLLSPNLFILFFIYYYNPPGGGK